MIDQRLLSWIYQRIDDTMASSENDEEMTEDDIAHCLGMFEAYQSIIHKINDLRRADGIIP